MALEALETRDLSFAACRASRHIEESAGGGTSVAPGRPLRSPASLSLASPHPPQMPLRALQQQAVWGAGKSRRLAGGEPGSSPSFACEGSPHPGHESSPLPGAVRAHVTIYTLTLGKPQGISFPSAATSHVSTDPGLRLFRTLIHRRLPLVSDALPGCPFPPWFVRAHLKPGLPGPCWLLGCLPLPSLWGLCPGRSGCHWKLFRGPFRVILSPKPQTPSSPHPRSISPAWKIRTLFNPDRNDLPQPKVG